MNQFFLRQYRVQFPEGTMFDQCACRAGLVVYHWWVENWCERKKN